MTDEDDFHIASVVEDWDGIWDSAVNVAEFFIKIHGDAAKAKLWFRTPNPLLGQLAPSDLVMLGMHKKLVNFITDAMIENATVKDRETGFQQE